MYICSMTEKQQLTRFQVPVPLYGRIFAILRQRILDQAYLPGDQLASEDRLATEFGVSRATIRQAIGKLAEEGLIERRQGRGTFIRETLQPHYGQRFRGSLADLIEETTRSGIRSVQLSRSVPINRRIAEILELSEGIATVVRRTRTLDGNLFAITVNYLPDDYGKLLKVSELRKTGLMTLLQSKGITYTRAYQSIRAERADISVATELDMDIDGPVLFVERRLLTDRDKPVAFVQSWYRGDVYEYNVTLEFRPSGGLVADGG
jgi:GntR family transcriptional regulator